MSHGLWDSLPRRDNPPSQLRICERFHGQAVLRRANCVAGVRGRRHERRGLDALEPLHSARPRKYITLSPKRSRDPASSIL